jgi:hypothetical protein
MVLIDWKEKNYGFHKITHNELISIEKMSTYKLQDCEHFISNETDEEKLIEKIEKILNKKG